MVWSRHVHQHVLSWKKNWNLLSSSLILSKWPSPCQNPNLCTGGNDLMGCALVGTGNQLGRRTAKWMIEQMVQRSHLYSRNTVKNKNNLRSLPHKPQRPSQSRQFSLLIEDTDSQRAWTPHCLADARTQWPSGHPWPAHAVSASRRMLQHCNKKSFVANMLLWPKLTW